MFKIKSVQIALFILNAILGLWAMPHACAQSVSTDTLDRGVVKSVSEAAITTDLSAAILHLPFKKGELFKKDDILVEFDCRRYREELAGAEAENRGDLATLKTQKEMASHQAAGRNEVEVAQAKYDKSTAAARALAVRIEQCTIRAPFSGRVAERPVHEFEVPQANTPLIKIIDDGHLEIELLIASKNLAWLKPGAPFQFVIDETGQSYDCKVARIGAAVDAVSQTVEVTGVFVKQPASVLPGMSGSATFTKPQG